MTSTAEPLVPERAARWWETPLEQLISTPRRARLFGWLAPTLVVLLAAVLRLAGLWHPHAFVFDETYYIKDAWTLLNLGYEASWPEGANESFLAGDTDVFRTDGSFVVHPPLGKWIIALGMLAFGPETGFGWRITTALIGTAAVLLLIVVGKALTGSIAFGVLAGFLFAIDGVGIVLSRVALLDNSLMALVLLAFWFVLLDRRRTMTRIAETAAARTFGDRPPQWGPVMWGRPWIIAAGAALGAATAVKWSGLWVLAGLGIYLVVTDALARRRADIAFWPTDSLLRQAPVTFLLFVPVAFAVYLTSWTGWLVTDGGYDRHSADDDPAEGFWSWVPLALQSLWRFHQAIYRFHVGLTADHGYQSPAWQWPFLARPTSMYWSSTPQGENGCEAANSCVQAITSVPNPLVWIAAVAAVLYLVYRFIATRDWRYALVLTGVVITYVPWLLYPDRTIFQFYTISILPFMLLALAFALRDIAGRRDAAVPRRLSGQWVVVIFLAFAVGVSAFYYPIWAGMEVSYDFWRAHFWSVSLI